MVSLAAGGRHVNAPIGRIYNSPPMTTRNLERRFISLMCQLLVDCHVARGGYTLAVWTQEARSCEIFFAESPPLPKAFLRYTSLAIGLRKVVSFDAPSARTCRMRGMFGPAFRSIVVLKPVLEVNSWRGESGKD